MKLPRRRVLDLADVFARADLGDERRSARGSKIVKKMAQHPQASMPETMKSVADLEAAYRFMSNPRVSLEALVAPYFEEVAARARPLKCVLAIHDTTTCKFAHADPEVVGYLNTGKAGFMVHYTLLAELAEIPRPLGIQHVHVFSRNRPPRKRKVGKQRSRPGATTTKKANRESLRWFNGIAQTAEQLGDTPIVHIADREGDAYDLLSKCVQGGHRFVIRVRVPTRRVRTKNGFAALNSVAAKAETAVLREVVLSARTASPAPASAKTHRTRRARQAQLQLSATSVELDRPRYFGKQLPPSLTVNIVRAVEIDVPRGEQAVEWLLFTSEPIQTPSQIERVVDIYRARWLIEECNKALKSGCLYEHRQFESREALLTLLGLSLPIACEILALRTEARRAPHSPASTRLSKSELEVLRHFSPRKLRDAPSLRQAVLCIAALGGHQKQNGPPGWLVIQRGLTKLVALHEGWKAALDAKK